MDDPSDFVKGTRLKSFFERVQESQANSPASSRNTSADCSPSVSLGSYNNNSNNNHNNNSVLSSPSASSAKSTPTSSGNFSRSIFGTSAFQMHIQETSPILKQQQKEQKEQQQQQNQNQNQMKILSSPPSTKNHQKSQSKSGNKNNNSSNKSNSSSLAVPVVPLSAASLEEENNSNTNNTQNLEVLQTIPAHLSTAPGSSPPPSATRSSQKSNSNHHKKNHKSHNNSNNNNKNKNSSAAADDGGEQPTNKNENDSSSVNEQQQQQQQNFFTRGPIPISVISKHFEQRKIKYIKQLGDRLHLGQRHNNNDMYCSYFLTLQEAAFVHQLFNQYRTDSRHPGSVVVVCAIKHSDGIVEVETEYCDVGPVERLYQYLDKPNYRYHAPIVAKSVARQVLLALQTFNVVHSKVHRAVSSRTVLVRRDGCVKLGIFDAIIRDDFNTSNSYANKFLTSPFCAPECRPSSICSTSNNNNQQQVIGKNFSAASSAPVFGSGNQNNNNNNNENNSSDFISRMNATALQTTDKKLIVDHFMKHSESHKADVWSVGVLILSILLKDSFFGDGSPKTTETLNELIFGRNNDALWCQIIPDTGLRFLTRRCLEIDPKKRISLNDAVALTFIFGRTQGFRRKSFAAVPDEKIWKQKQMTTTPMSKSTSSNNDNDNDHNDDDDKTKKNSTTISTIPPWARYTECPFSTPDFIPSDDDDEEYEDVTVAAEEMKKSISGNDEKKSNNDDDNDDDNSNNNNTPVAASSTPTTPNARRNHQKKQEEVPMKDIIATRHLCKLLDESTMEPETKLLSCLPCCCIAASSSENNDNNINCTSDAPINQQKIEEIIHKHTRRVSVLLDLELRSHLTKRLNNPSGILHIEKQMKEVMKMRVQPAMRCLRAIVSDISTIRRQQQQQQKK